MIRRLVCACTVGLLVSTSALAQDSTSNTSGQYFGPRVGVTFLAPGVVDKAKEKGAEIAPVILQFGWQWETRFDPGQGAPTLASAFVLLIGGAEQGVIIPSLAWLLGVRGSAGGEFGIGPVASLTGINLALAFGGTKRNGEVNIPFDIVAVFGEPGMRVSLLTGFNMSRKRLTQ